MRLIKVSKVEYLYIRKYYPHLMIHAKWGLRNLRIILEFEKHNIWKKYNDWKKHKYDNIKKFGINADSVMRRLCSHDFNYLIYPRQCGKTYEYYRRYLGGEAFDFYKRFIVPIMEVDKVNKNMTSLSDYLKYKFIEEMNFERELFAKWRV